MIRRIMSGTSEWVTDGSISTQGLSESSNGPPPYSLVDPLPQNRNDSSLHPVSKFVLVLSIKVDVNL